MEEKCNGKSEVSSEIFHLNKAASNQFKDTTTNLMNNSPVKLGEWRPKICQILSINAAICGSILFQRFAFKLNLFNIGKRFLHIDQSRLLIRQKTSTDAQLRAHERSVVLTDCAISKIDVSQLAANRPIEDYHSAAKCLSSNAHLIGVFDGHGGASCSRHVSARLFDYLCASVLEKHIVENLPLMERLQWLFSSGDHRLPSFVKDEHIRNVQNFFDRFKNDPDLKSVRKAIQAAFIAMDDDISQGAMPDNVGRVDRIAANVAASGSCATVAHLRKCHLHVANIGDSAAVLGISQNHSMTSRQLSRPHCVENDDEVQRIRHAHPISESGTILRGSRLLGELYPLRAFGDVRYKWTEDLQRVVLEPLGVLPPQGLHTPPYLTAMPEVFYHKLTSNDKFLVIATDGLWEWLEPDSVVRLIHDHTLGTQTLSLYQPEQGTSLLDVCKDLERRKQGESKKPLDENSATHVIRNALGGVSGGTELQYERLKESLQLPPGMARHYRDDITVIVIHFSESYLSSIAESEDHCGF
uniref:PPM-type phosphatase domain-containing protein n=1 Tax=Panagrolaimus sp. PS1159 TaxID=55785 RepID=A0AC35GNH5_9BILA